MNTCMVIASTMWLHFNDGYVMQYLNANNIANISPSGTMYTMEKSGSRYTIWDEQKDRYLDGDEIMGLIMNCDRGHQ